MKNRLSGKEKLGLGVGAMALVSVAIAVVPGAIVAMADTVKKITEPLDKKEENKTE